ncbi:5-carboxymethyl-2-hydroxymuconate Delta-isomerase [Sneathiella limimaris]|uniref:5-carboxymethyl-2-hydroxymuconate Delta-isomerase n=1 Tax=Sneathiella limimaris TaxID=1964213 RepID=UPI00146D34B9|nr:5-carboxymethyl-2-hydroxymuconate isomerase [Sneathiella limimaris]
MPHFVIEYSREVENQADMVDIMDVTFQAGLDSGIMNAKDIKVRARPYDFFKLVEDGQTFLHVTVFLLDGRTDEVKENLALLLRERLAEKLPSVSSVSIDICDMNRTAYKKRVLEG